MIGEDAIRAILNQYDRYGWQLRSVLLSAELQIRLGPATPELFGDVEIKQSDIDAAWFSRASRGGSVTWELRWFSDPPFALLEVIGPDTEPNEVEGILRGTENQLRERIKRRTHGH
jgi:hypothetical protein